MTASSHGRGRSPGFALLIALVPLALAAAVLGCSGRPVNSPPPEVVARPWVNAGEVRPSQDGDVDCVAGLCAILADRLPPPPPGRPFQVLVMSGGGKYGAFTAGVLNGWTATGCRPTFDIATGISSGAVSAVLAFLGPKYDRQLERYFTALKRSDLFNFHPLRGIVSRTGLLTSEPLERLLAREITDEFLGDLRTAHAEGRRVYVGTANVMTNRMAVWDLGAIACSGRPDAPVLLRKILLASCSPPGAVVPVEIEVVVNGVRYTELHSDAGNFAQAFIRSPCPIPADSTLWVLSAGKVYRDRVEGDRPRLLGLLGAGISNSLYALFRSDVMRVYALCAVSRARFRLIVLPEDFRGKASSFDFDAEEQRRMYWVGYQLGANGSAWTDRPPGTLPDEVSSPRTGLDFRTRP